MAVSQILPKALQVVHRFVPSYVELPDEVDLLVRVASVERKEGPRGFYWAVLFEAISEDYKGLPFHYNISEGESTVWKQAKFQEALGFQEGETFTLEACVGRTCTAHITREWEVWEGGEGNRCNIRKLWAS